jgi:hypothetical protein
VTIDARRAQDAVATEVWTVVQARFNPTAQARALSEAAP